MKLNTINTAKKIFFTVLAYSLMIGCLQARDLSLDRAIELAWFNNKDMQIADLNIEEKQNSAIMANSAKHFRIDAAIDCGVNYLNKEDIAFVNNYLDPNAPLIPRKYTIDNSSFYQATLNLNLVKPIYDFGKLESLVKIARFNSDISNYEKEQIRREVKYATTIAYYNALLADSLLTFSKKTYESALISKKILIDTSDIPYKIDLIRVESYISFQKAEVLKAEQFMKESYLILKNICNISYDESITIKADSKIKNIYLNQNEFEQILLNYPESKILKVSAEIHKNLADAKKTEKFPEITAYLGYTGKLFSNKISFEEPMAENIIYAGIKIQAPLRDNGLTDLASQKEIIEEQKIKLAYVKYYKDLEKKFLNMLEKYRINLEIYENQKKSVELAQKAYDLSVSRFKVGQTSIVELNDTDSNLTDAVKGTYLLFFEIKTLEAQIERLIGVL